MLRVGLGCLSLAAVPFLHAQQVAECGLHAVGTVARSELAAGGLYAARRVSERTRLAASLAGGVSEGRAAFRGEVLGHFLLNPRSAHQPGLYALAGVAWVSAGKDEGLLVIGAGLEARPGSRSGWAVEAGVGGGVRVSLGYRWRRFPPGWVSRE